MRILGALLASMILFAHGDTGGKPITLEATVIDTGCYMGHATQGAKHIQCATTCAKAGVPLALVEAKSGTLYLPVAMDHKNPNEKLMPFIEKRVTVSGNLYVKGGMKGIVITTIAAAQ